MTAAGHAGPAAPVWVDAWEPADGAARARAAFAERFAGAPGGVWSAPGRVNLIGEHTDYNGGLCLAIALPHHTYLAPRPRDDGVLRLPSAPGTGQWAAGLGHVLAGAGLGRARVRGG